MSKVRPCVEDRSLRGPSRREHRIRILCTLIDICRRIEQLQVSAGARRACREVAALIGTALARESAASGARRR